MSATLNCNIVTFHDGGGLDVKSWLTLEILWTVACQAPLSMGLFRQEYWSGLPFPSPGDLPDPRTEYMVPAWQVDSLPLSHLGSPSDEYTCT